MADLNNQTAVTETRPALYMPALDGLRFIAFLLVFNLHLGQQYISGGSGFAQFLVERGWVGVEMFFCISAFLFFRLMEAEFDETLDLDIQKFFARRFLRLYPLMIVFPILMMLIYGQLEAWRSLLSIALGFDDFAVWTRGFNPIPYSAHLWTLSAEFQLYLVIPFVFLGSRRLGDRRFLIVIAVVAGVGIACRFIAVSAGAHHPIVWVTPMLHPEATLFGMAAALSISRKLDLRSVAIAGAIALIAFASASSYHQHGNGRMWIYPMAALFCASAVWLAASGRLPFLSVSWVAYLGKISFGLYVFHLLAIALASSLLTRIGVEVSYLPQFVVALCICVVMAAASYRFFELPFLRAKVKLEIVKSRPV